MDEQKPKSISVHDGERTNQQKYGGEGEHGKPTSVSSPVPEKKVGEINPSAPGETGTTPDSGRKS